MVMFEELFKTPFFSLKRNFQSNLDSNSTILPFFETFEILKKEVFCKLKKQKQLEDPKVYS